MFAGAFVGHVDHRIVIFRSVRHAVEILTVVDEVILPFINRRESCDVNVDSALSDASDCVGSMLDFVVVGDLRV